MLVHDGAFDATISLEAIIATLEERLRTDLEEELGARLAARVDLLESLCGRKRSSQWTSVTIGAKRDFAEAYVKLAGEILPELRVRPSSDGPKAITRLFEGLDLGPALPTPSLRHEFGNRVSMKYANVQFPGLGSRAGAVTESRILDATPYSAKEAGKSLSTRVETPGIDPTLPFELETEKVRVGLMAIRGLVTWLATNRGVVAAVIGGDTSSKTEVTAVDTDMEKKFTETLFATYRECEKLGYKPTGMLEMIGRLGGIRTARQLLANPPFRRLHTFGGIESP